MHLITIDDTTYLFIKKCLKILCKNHLALIFIFLSILCNTMLLLATLYIERIYTGIDIFNFNSLSALFHTDFWVHIFHFLSLFCVFSFGIIIATFFKSCLTIVYVETLQNKKITFFQALKISFNQIKVIIRLSLIRVFDYPDYWDSIIDPVEGSKRIKKLLEKKNFFEQENDQYSNPQHILLFPITIKESLQINDALEKSEKLMNSTFGTLIKDNYLYNKIRLLIIYTTIISSFIIIHFILRFHVFFTILVALYFCIVLFHILGDIILLFNTIIYNYCNGNNSDDFPPEDIKKIFS